MNKTKIKRNLWNATHKCLKCNDLMKKKNLVIEGTTLRAWECSKCKDTVLHPKDAQRMFLLNKLKRGLPVKIGELGKSLIVRIPKEIAKIYRLTKGEQITVKAESDTKIELDISA